MEPITVWECLEGFSECETFSRANYSRFLVILDNFYLWTIIFLQILFKGVKIFRKGTPYGVKEVLPRELKKVLPMELDKARKKSWSLSNISADDTLPKNYFWANVKKVSFLADFTPNFCKTGALAMQFSGKIVLLNLTK